MKKVAFGLVRARNGSPKRIVYPANRLTNSLRLKTLAEDTVTRIEKSEYKRESADKNL